MIFNTALSAASQLPMSEDVGIKTRTVVTMAIAVRCSNYIIYLAPETGTGSEAGVVTGSEAGVVAGSKAGVVTGSKAGVVTRSRKPAAAENQKQRWTITNLPGK